MNFVGTAFSKQKWEFCIWEDLNSPGFYWLFWRNTRAGCLVQSFCSVLHFTEPSIQLRWISSKLSVTNSLFCVWAVASGCLWLSLLPRGGADGGFTFCFWEMEKVGMATGRCSLGGFCFRGTPLCGCAVWSLGSGQLLWPITQRWKVSTPLVWVCLGDPAWCWGWVGQAAEHEGSHVSVFIHFWALHSSTEWCCVDNGESDTLLKAFHFHNSEACFHISESNWLPAVHRPYVIFILHSQLFHEHCPRYQLESQ